MKKALFVLLAVLWTMHAYGEKRALFLIWKEPGYKGWQSLISQLGGGTGVGTGGGTGGAGSEAGGSGGNQSASTSCKVEFNTYDIGLVNEVDAQGRNVCQFGYIYNVYSSDGSPAVQPPLIVSISLSYSIYPAMERWGFNRELAYERLGFYVVDAANPNTVVGPLPYAIHPYINTAYVYVPIMPAQHPYYSGAALIYACFDLVPMTQPFGCPFNTLQSDKVQVSSTAPGSSKEYMFDRNALTAWAPADDMGTITIRTDSQGCWHVVGVLCQGSSCGYSNAPAMACSSSGSIAVSTSLPVSELAIVPTEQASCVRGWIYAPIY